MKFHFYKYQGTGNDFVLLDNRKHPYPRLQQETVAALCNRRFGIGADGLILLELEEGVDFKMIYYNSDGRESSMCGNGGRCIARFAHDLDFLEKDTFRFNAIDGLHEAEVLPDKVRLRMGDVKNVEKRGEHAFFTDTGSPHYVEFVQEAMQMNILEPARAIRYNETYKAEGVNVNFVDSQDAGTLAMRTYERGVEDETYSCGTGVTAAVLAAYTAKKVKYKEVKVQTKGGELSVSFEHGETGFTNIWLSGPAERVFEGKISL